MIYFAGAQTPSRLARVKGWQMRLAVLFAILLAVVSGSAVRAAERVALVVASPSRSDGEPLPHVEKSAARIVEGLAAAGFAVRFIVDPSSDRLRLSVKELALRLSDPASAAVFYYAGDALQVDGTNYLLTRDADIGTPGSIKSGAVSLDALQETFDGMPGAKLILVDAGYDHPLPGLHDAERGLAAVEPGRNTMLVFASSPGQVAARNAGPTTLFADTLAEALAEPGMDFDALGERVKRIVGAATAGAQIPWSASNQDGVVYLQPDADGPDVAVSEPARTQTRGLGSLYDDAEEVEAKPQPEPDTQPRPAPRPTRPVEGGAHEPRPSESDSATSEEPSDEAERWAKILERNNPDLLRAFLDYQAKSKEYDEKTRQLEDVLKTLVSRPSPSAPAENKGAALGGDDDAAVDEPTTLVRHPALDAPDEVGEGETITVSIALTEEQHTPEVSVRAAPGTTVTDEGAFRLAMPAQAEEWPVDIDLLAAGFDLADDGKWSRRVTLYRHGDSDVARFEIRARSISGERKERQLIARLYHEGRFLGSATRPIVVLGEQPPAPGTTSGNGQARVASPRMAMLASLPPQQETVLTGDITLGESVEAPDLDVTIHYDDPDNLGEGLIVIHSPHIGAPVSAEFTTPAGMNAWLDSEYKRLVQLGLKLRGAESLKSTGPLDGESQRRFVTRVAEGLGSELYRNYVPAAFKDVFWSLKRAGRLRSIQITSNSPVFPWELVRAQSPDGEQDGFLGLDYRLARWAPRSTGDQVDRPLNRLPFTGVAAVAPAYEGNRELPFQRIEVEALKKLEGFQQVDGDFSSFERMVGEVSTGFVHFSGHGEINDPGTGAPVFAIQLSDQALDPATWRSLAFAPRDRGNPFYFFNACDTGRATSLGGFVQGWGPAVLSSGASGFIGGMWPLSDRTAATFSTQFYGAISEQLPEGPVYLAKILQDVRKEFYRTGDPTFLAYTFYGNANLQVTAR